MALRHIYEILQLILKVLQHRAEMMDNLNRRITDLELWRKNNYGTYQATDEDYERWSGQKPGQWVMD